MKSNPKDFIPNQKSTGADWQSWYESLRSFFPKTTANELWLKAWSKRKGKDATTIALSKYMEEKKTGINIELSTIQNIGSATLTGIDKIEGIFGMGKTVLFIVGGIIILPIGLMLFNIARNPNTTITASGNAVGKAKGGM